MTRIYETRPYQFYTEYAKIIFRKNKKQVKIILRTISVKIPNRDIDNIKF